MKKVYRLKNLGCAHCAAKMERAINKLDGVKCSIVFMTCRMTLEYETEPDINEIQRIIHKYEKDCDIQ
ncbi:MAG: cation transporter [Clostridia bacterium]|nr:cation transporter [Clostridia bacterium]